MIALDDCLFAADALPSTGRSRPYRILAATEPVIELPALVRRGAQPQSISLDRAARGLRGLIGRCDALTVDVETSGYPVGHRHYQLRTIQLGGEATAVVFDATDPDHTTVVRELLATTPRLHAHSATADLVPLAHAGLVDYDMAWTRMHDTVIPAKLADPASTGSDPGLKKLAGKVLADQAVTPAAEEARSRLFKQGGWLTDTEATTPPTRSGWAQVDSRWPTMVTYAASDVLDTAALARQLPPVPAALLDRERTVQAMAARVAFTGLPLDHQQVTALLGKHHQARAEAGRRVRAFGVGNPGSDQQVGEALTQAGARLPLTDTGRPSVAGEVLAPLRNTPGLVGELVGAVLDYRGHEPLLSTFLEPYDQLVRYGDGRVRPTVYTLGARTGRMSCVRPNCQNVPRTGGVRGCIIADPGYVLVSADFAGIELRVAAALSGDAQLARIIAEDDAAKAQDPKAKTDIHWKIAWEVFGPNATKADRYAVKPMVYGKLYGAGVPTLAAQVGCSIDVAAAVVNTLDAITPTLAEWSAKLRSRVEAGLVKFPIYSGATLHLPRERPHAAPNYAIQRTAREILVDAMLRWRDTPWGGAVLLPVHDEIIAMVPEQDGPAAIAALVACMQTQFRGVPIVAEADEPSYAWADAA
jgi:DNA polymerase I-like protein with 3'-5' exonuclease and polymerase domains